MEMGGCIDFLDGHQLIESETQRLLQAWSNHLPVSLHVRAPVVIGTLVLHDLDRSKLYVIGNPIIISDLYVWYHIYPLFTILWYHHFRRVLQDLFELERMIIT